MLYTIGIGPAPAYDAARIAVLDLKKHTSYVRGRILYAVPFDAERMEVTGSERPVVEGVRAYTATGLAEYSFSDAGLLVYMSSDSGRYRSTLEWRDRKGVATPIAAPPEEWSRLALSPDGRRVAGSIRSRNGTFDIWVHDIARNTFLRLTFGGTSTRVAWTPDSRRVAFTATVSGKNNIYWVAADGNGKPELLATVDGVATVSSWTPDGKALIFRPAPHPNLWILPAGATGGDNNLAIELGDGRVVDGAHTAFAELEDDLAMTDGGGRRHRGGVLTIIRTESAWPASEANAECCFTADERAFYVGDSRYVKDCLDFSSTIGCIPPRGLARPHLQHQTCISLKKLCAVSQVQYPMRTSR